MFTDHPGSAQILHLLCKRLQDIRTPSLRTKDNFPSTTSGNDERAGLVIKGKTVGVGTDLFGGVGVEVWFTDFGVVVLSGAAIGWGIRFSTG